MTLVSKTLAWRASPPHLPVELLHHRVLVLVGEFASPHAHYGKDSFRGVAIGHGEHGQTGVDEHAGGAVNAAIIDRLGYGHRQRGWPCAYRRRGIRLAPPWCPCLDLE